MSELKNMRPSSAITSFFLSLSFLFGTANAQDASRPKGPGDKLVGETIADRPSNLYIFERHNLDSADGKRHYRIEIAIPKAPAPKTGYAVLYMLDGNAAMDTIKQEDLVSISRVHPPVLVAIGYDVPTRNDVVSRAYDYTPPVYKDGSRVQEPVVRGRVGGGADVFLDLITTRIKPLVRERANVDPNNEFLWGHSYGGLFTLYSLFTQPDAFTRYIAGDPSAWWHDGVLAETWRVFPRQAAAGKSISILVGTKPRPPTASAPNPSSDPQTASQIDPRGLLKEIAEGLRASGANLSYEEFPENGHGDMIRTSLERALKIAVQPSVDK